MVEITGISFGATFRLDDQADGEVAEEVLANFVRTVCVPSGKLCPLLLMCKRVAIVTSSLGTLNIPVWAEGRLSTPMMKVTGHAEVVLDHKIIDTNGLSEKAVVAKNARCIKLGRID